MRRLEQAIVKPLPQRIPCSIALVINAAVRKAGWLARNYWEFSQLQTCMIIRDESVCEAHEINKKSKKGGRLGGDA